MRQIIPEKNVWFWPALVLRFLLYVVATLIYSVSANGRDRIPREGAVLLVSNHLSYVDVFLLQLVYPRCIHFLAHQSLFQIWWLGWMLRMMGTVSITPRSPRRALGQVVEKLNEGKVVCIFPEGGISRTGSLQRLKHGFEMVARMADCPIQPAFIDGVWGSVFSFSGNRAFWKRPLPYRQTIRVNFGSLIPAGEGAVEKTRESMLDLGAQAFASRGSLEGHLASRAVQSLARRPWKRQLVDTYPERRDLSRGKLLGVAVAYSRHLRATVREKRVGVALPPGAGGTVANLAIVLAGKIPVNINFTAGKAVTEACYRRSGIQTVVTASAFEQRLTDFPWPENRIDLPRELKSLDKRKLAGWVALAYVLPARLLPAVLRLPRRGGDEEAALLFTSGSSDEPKGVVLTHRNILANIEQISGVNLLLPRDSFLASLPLFHSFGFTVTFWYPIIEGIPLVTSPSPLEVGKIAEAVRNEKPTAIFGTPSFLRPYVRKIDREDFSSLRLAVAGAEKLPARLRDEFEQKFGISIMEGYGLTETAPVVSVNIPNPVFRGEDGTMVGERRGSVGRLLPGIAVRIVGQEERKPISSFESGILFLKGANVFGGYLADETATGKAFRDGWYVTGDVARFDEDGFLYIEGRVSRFSKIGGEMVPHGVVEERIREVMNLSRDQVVVVGVRDETDRERLVVLASVDIDEGEMRREMRAARLANQWLPAHVFRVEEIPLLGTGKLDLKNCQAMAEKCWRRQGRAKGGGQG